MICRDNRRSVYCTKAVLPLSIRRIINEELSVLGDLPGPSARTGCGEFFQRTHGIKSYISVPSEKPV